MFSALLPDPEAKIAIFTMRKKRIFMHIKVRFVQKHLIFMRKRMAFPKKIRSFAAQIYKTNFIYNQKL
jgi:hypothetical protein